MGKPNKRLIYVLGENNIGRIVSESMKHTGMAALSRKSPMSLNKQTELLFRTVRRRTAWKTAENLTEEMNLLSGKERQLLKTRIQPLADSLFHQLNYQANREGLEKVLANPNNLGKKEIEMCRSGLAQLRKEEKNAEMLLDKRLRGIGKLLGKDADTFLTAFSKSYRINLQKAYEKLQV